MTRIDEKDSCLADAVRRELRQRQNNLTNRHITWRSTNVGLM